MGHAERAHALLSASGAHRWLVCTPSAKLEEQFPDSTSEAAREGTLAHELAELKVRHYFYTTDFGKRKYTTRVNKLKKEELWKDEMERFSDEYLEYLKVTALNRVRQYGARLRLQVRKRSTGRCRTESTDDAVCTGRL